MSDSLDTSAGIASPDDVIPQGFEPFVLEFVGHGGIFCRVEALVKIGSEWCVNPLITVDCAHHPDEWHVSHISGSKLTTWPLVKDVAVDAARRLADLCPRFTQLSVAERLALSPQLHAVIDEAEARDADDAQSAERLAKSGEAHA